MRAKLLQLCPTLCDPWAVSRQAPLSMGFSRQEYWSGLLCLPPGDLPDPEINLKAFSVYFFYVLKPPQTHEFEFLQSGLIQKTESLSFPGSPVCLLRPCGPGGGVWQTLGSL